MKLAVILFAYKRPRTLKRIIKSHTKLEGVDYYCFIDHSPMQKLIYEIVESVQLYTVYLRDTQLGLNANITTGITKIFNQGYDAVIVLEDDLVIDNDALEWLKMRLEFFQGDKRYGAVALSKGDVLNKAFRCWGWGTWKHVWDKINWTLEVTDTYKNEWDKTHSWDWYMCFWMELNNLYTRCGEKNRVKHIGHFGVHHKWYSKFGIRRHLRKFKQWGKMHYHGEMFEDVIDLTKIFKRNK